MFGLTSILIFIKASKFIRIAIPIFFVDSLLN